MERPDKWVILKLQTKNEKPYYKVFGTWYGGYLDGDSWQMNSGIIKVNSDDISFYFCGVSGSIYRCHIKSYGTSNYTTSVLDNIILNAYKVNTKIEIMPENTEWEKIF
jgi:hypothetical protein